MPGNNCQVFSPDTLAGVTFGDVEFTMPVSGSILISLQATANPDIAEVSIVDLNGLDHPPFSVAGHLIQIVSISVISQSIQWHRNLPANNVYGSYDFNYQLLIDGSIPATLIERGSMLASFDAATGAWPNVEFVGGFGLLGDIPASSMVTNVALGLALAASAYVVFRRVT